MSYDAKLTTKDNPFDPFEQFDAWHLFDIEKGYQCCERLAKVARISDEMTQKEIDAENERAIDEIIKHDFTDCYKKVTKTYEEPEE